MASMFDLTKHDARFHKDGYKDGDNCMYRQAIKDYESVDDLSVAGKISDALEDAELLESQIGKMKNENVRNRLREHQKAAMTRAKMHLPKNMSPKKPLSHDESAFPSENDTDWQDALMNYGNSRYGWHSAGSGSTSPHYIDINGKRYFVKKAGVNPSYNSNAARNEVNANQFIRLAGFTAPDSKYYDVPGMGQFAVSAAADISGGQLASGVGDKKVRSAVEESYPLMALMYNMDLMQNSDNAFIDGNGNPVFLDNGSTFGFSAQGARNKYYDYDMRTDPFPSKSTSGGLTGLLDVGNNGSAVWNKFLKGKTSKDDLLKLCAKYNMSALVEAGEKKGLIPKSAISALKDYAKKLDLLSDKYRDKSQQQSGSQYKVSPAAAFWKSVSRPDLKDIEADAASSGEKGSTGKKSSAKNSGSEKSVDDQIADLAKKHGLTVPKVTKNSDGTVTLSGFGSASTKQMLDFIHDLNDNGLLPGFIASLSGSGNGQQIQVQSAINNGNASSLFGGMFSGLSFSGGGFGGYSSASSSHGSLNGVSSGGFSFSGGLTSSSAQSLANQFNQNNSNSGYTAKATQTSTGEWQVTLYPTDQKKIAKSFVSEDGHSTGSTSSSGGSHGGETSKSNSSSGSSQGSSSSSSSSSSSHSSGSSGGSHQSSRPSRPHSSSGGSSSGSQSSSASSSQPSTPAPNINTQTPQQVAATVAQMPKAAAGAFVNMLKKREANPATPAGLKAKYQRILSLLGAAPASTTTQPSQPASSQQPASGASAGGIPAISAAGLALTSPLAKRLQHKLSINKPGTPYYDNLVKQLNTLAAGGGQPAASQQHATVSQKPVRPTRPGQGAPAAAQATSQAQPVMPANIPNNPAAQRLVKMIGATSDPAKKAQLIANLNKMIGN